jgi:phospholipase/carboxylesterase
MNAHQLLHRPTAASPGNRTPLLVLLHGKGANEEDLFGLAQYFDPRFMVISLRAPHEIAPGYYRWYERIETPQGTVFDEAEIEASRRWLIQTIDDAVVTLNADPQQVHLLGFSQGGAMALALALTAPHRLRSVTSIAGRLLRACLPFAAPAEAIRSLHLLIQHGTQDEMVPHAESLAACAHFAELGLQPVFKDYPAGHTISPAMLKDALEFLRGQLPR